MFASLMPEDLMERMGKIYVGKPMKTKTRKELLESIRPNHRRYLREDCGDLPEGWSETKSQPSEPEVLATSGD
jgi:hypothetical protein